MNGSFPIRTPTDLAATALDRTHKFMTWLPGGYIKQEKLTKPSLSFVGLVMFFNWVNLDSKLRVAILGQDFVCVVTLFRFPTLGSLNPPCWNPKARYLYFIARHYIFIYNGFVYETHCREGI